MRVSLVGVPVKFTAWTRRGDNSVIKVSKNQSARRRVASYWAMSAKLRDEIPL